MMLGQILGGAGLLGQGFGMWRRRPRTMALGLVPAVIAFILLAAALVTLGVNLPRLVDWSTPFADSWVPWLQSLVRITLGIVLFGAGAALAVVTFTAVTLTIGDPFYERIHREVEAELGPPLPNGSTGFWRAAAGGLELVALGLLVALLAAVLGFIPVVGAALSAVVGVVLTGWLLARELTGRAFDARGFDRARRARIIAAGRWRVLGFGIATQLCFLVPLGAVVTMPAAVAGATILVRDLLEREGSLPRTP